MSVQAALFPYNPSIPAWRTYIVTVEVSGPSSYSTGGFEVEVPNVRRVLAVLAVNDNSGYMFKVDPGSVADGDNKFKIIAYQFDYAAASAGPAVEVPAGTDLSNVKLRITVLAEP